MKPRDVDKGQCWPILIFQIVILVVDSTDRERLSLTKEELHRMLSHEVQTHVWLFGFTI